jgi:hypothetical protein
VQIEKAWRKSGVYPLDAAVMEAEEEERPVTPEPGSSMFEPDTLRNIRILRSNSRGVRRGEIDARVALAKAEKAVEVLLAMVGNMGDELEGVRAARELDEAARGARARVTYTHGTLFDPAYAASHAEELAERKAWETAAKGKKRDAARKGKKRAAPESGSEPEAGPVRSVMV